MELARLTIGKTREMRCLVTLYTAAQSEENTLWIVYLIPIQTFQTPMKFKFIVIIEIN